MLPIFLLMLSIGLWYNVVPSFVIILIVTVITIDYMIPLGTRSKPNRQTSYRHFKLGAEGIANYHSARSICLCRKELSKVENKYKSYILASWPHGLMGGGSHGGLIDFFECGSNEFQPIYSAASVLKYVPVVRRLHAMWGICDVTKSELTRILKHQESTIIHLVVGGIEEMFYTTTTTSGTGSNHHNFEQIVINKRKGFIKLAIECGIDIIPHYTFGANETYTRYFNHTSLLARLSHTIRTSLIFWTGRWYIPFGYIPKKVPLLSVAGNIFHIPKVSSKDEITKELIEETHTKFCLELKQLFNTYKIVYVNEMNASKEWLTKELLFEDDVH